MDTKTRVTISFAVGTKVLNENQALLAYESLVIKASRGCKKSEEILKKIKLD